MKNKIVRLISLNNIIQKTIDNPEIYPHYKHSIIFSNEVSGEIKKIIKSLNLKMENDYSENYEDDMKQYASMVNKLSEKLKPLIVETEHENSSVKLLKILANDVNTVIKSELEWEEKYDLIFSDTLSSRIYETLKNINIRFDYYDPDTSYEEDAVAFSNGLNNFLTENFS